MSAKTILVTLQELAATAVDKAAEELGASNQTLTNEKNTLLMLEKYRDEYLDKLSGQMVAGFNIQMHQNYQRFLSMLDDAIKGQAQVVENTKLKVAMDQKVWQENNKKKFSYEVLGDRYQKREDVLEGRREQKLMDEFAMRGSKVRLA